jgi:spore coat protein U-like protein
LQTAGVLIGNKISANISLQNEKRCQQESLTAGATPLIPTKETSMNKHTRFTSNALKLALMALAISAAGSALAAIATATSTSTVIAPIAITKVADLAFGSFGAGAAGGTVTVSPNGNRGVSGGAIAAGGTPSAAQFNVTGEAGMGFGITLGGTTELSNGSSTMTFAPISDTSASAITSGTVATGTLTSGAQSIYVGGILTVGANQAAGTYTGTVTATVEYN